MSITHDFAMRDIERRRWGRGQLLNSPVDSVLQTLPRGKGDWQGFDSVYDRLQSAAHKMAREKYIYLSDEHVTTMAIMGCGHEETMKAELHRLMARGFIV